MYAKIVFQKHNQSKYLCNSKYYIELAVCLSVITEIYLKDRGKSRVVLAN